MTLHNTIKSYLNHLIQRNYSPRTIETYTGDLSYLSNFFPHQSLTDLNVNDLRYFQRHLFTVKSKANGRDTLSPATQGRILTVTRMLFKFATKYDYIASDPSAGIELPREEKRLPKDILSLKGIKKMIEASDKECFLRLRNRAMMEVLYATGMRVSELTSLTIYSIRSNDLSIRTLGKGRKERIVPISGRAMILTEEYVQTLRPILFSRNEEKAGITLFLSLKGKPLQRCDVSSLIKKLAKGAEIKTTVTPHTIRHTVATHLLKNGMDVRYIQELLGHEDLRTTQRYTKVENSDLQEMIERHHPLR